MVAEIWTVSSLNPFIKWDFIIFYETPGNHSGYNITLNRLPKLSKYILLVIFINVIDIVYMQYKCAFELFLDICIS